MLVETALAAVVIGLLLGGSLKKLADIRLRFLPLLAVSVLFSILPKIPVSGSVLAQMGMPAAYFLCLVRYGSLLAFVFANRSSIPVLIVGLGGGLNAAVTLLNGGAMPVSARAAAMTSASGRALLESGGILNYRVASSATRLSFLCDRIVLRGFFTYSLSAGDLLIAAGIFTFILLQMKPRFPKKFLIALRHMK